MDKALMARLSLGLLLLVLLLPARIYSHVPLTSTPDRLETIRVRPLPPDHTDDEEE